MSSRSLVLLVLGLILPSSLHCNDAPQAGARDDYGERATNRSCRGRTSGTSQPCDHPTGRWRSPGKLDRREQRRNNGKGATTAVSRGPEAYRRR